MDNEIDVPPEAWMVCPLCHSDLHFEYDIDYILLRIQEKCDCPTCGFKRKSVESTIQ